MKKLTIETTAREQLLDVTSEISSLVQEDGGGGVCTLYVPHTTAAVTINESADPDVAKDLIDKLSELIPKGEGYSHREGNADSHIKSSLIGNTTSIFVREGQLQLGTWQGIFFAEFDGPRTRQLWVGMK